MLNSKALQLSLLLLTVGTTALVAQGCAPKKSSPRTAAPSAPIATTATASASTSPAVTTVLSGFLALADITPAADINTADPSTIVSSLEGVDALYENQPQSTNSAACNASLNKIVAQATKTTVILSGTVDLTACSNTENSSDPSPATLSSVTVKVYIAVNCVGGDLTPLNGLLFSQLSVQQKVFQSCTSSTQLTNSVYTTVGSQASTDASGGPVTIAFTSKQIQFVGNSSMGACGAIHGSGYGNDCIFVTRTITTSGTAAATEDDTKLTFSGLVDDGTSTSVWHSAGQINVTYDNWTGSLKYSSPSTAPTYSLIAPGQTALSGNLTALSD